jgi:hypothetical protein
MKYLKLFLKLWKRLRNSLSNKFQVFRNKLLKLLFNINVMEKKVSGKKMPPPDKVVPANHSGVVRINSNKVTETTSPKASVYTTLAGRFNLPGIWSGLETSKTGFVNLFLPEGQTRTEIFHLNDIDFITEDEMSNGEYIRKESARVAREIEVEVEQMRKDLAAKLMAPKRDLINDSFDGKPDKWFIHGGYVSTGCMIDDKKFIQYKTIQDVPVRNLLLDDSDNGDYVVHIPTDWMDAAGFTKNDLASWINFINSMNFEVPLKLEEAVGQIPNFVPYPNIKTIRHFVTYGAGGGADLSKAVVLNNNSAYRVILTGCECGHVNLFVFDLLMMIVDPMRFNIMGVAVQAKNALEYQITNLEALMIGMTFHPMLMSPPPRRKSPVFPKNQGVLNKLQGGGGDKPMFRATTAATLTSFNEGTPINIKPNPYNPGKIEQADLFPKMNVPDVFDSNNSVHMLCRRLSLNGATISNAFVLKQIPLERWEKMKSLIEQKEYPAIFEEYKTINNEQVKS